MLATLVAPLSAGDSGRIPLVLPKAAQDLDERIEFVSEFIAEDPIAAGLGWKPDDGYGDEAALELIQAEFRSLVVDRREWLAERRDAVDRLIGHELLHIQTRHFALALDLPEITVGRKSLARLEAGLLYASRIEDYHDHVLASLRIDDSRLLGTRHQVFLIENRVDAEKLANAVLGQSLGTGYTTSQVGPQLSAMILWEHPERITSDEDRHQLLVHGLAHHVYHDVGRYTAWLYEAFGWLYEGLAFYDEITLFGPPKTTCHPTDSAEFKHWLTPYWEANIRKALKTRRDPDPSTVFARSTARLDVKQRQFAWSYVDFLMWKDPARMVDLLDRTKGDQQPTADAIEATYGLNPEQFQAEWRTFVKKQYKSKTRKGPTPPRSKDRDR